MAINADEILVASSGAVYVAPVGTETPTSPTGVLPTGWQELGLLTEDGVSLREDMDFERFYGWSSMYPKDIKPTRRDIIASFTLQQWSRDTVVFAFGGGSVSGSFRYQPPGTDGDHVALLIEWQDGGKNYRLILPSGRVVGDTETTVSRGSNAVLPITYITADFDGYTVVTDDPAWAGSVEEEVLNGLRPVHSSGRYYWAPAHMSARVTGTAMVQNRLCTIPFWVPEDVTVDRIGVHQVTGAAGSVVRMGIFNDDDTGMGGTLLLDAGTASTETATNNQFRQLTISQALTGRNWYWLAVVAQGGAPTLTQCDGAGGGPIPVGLTATPAAGLLFAAGYFQDGVTGALPASFSNTVPTSSVTLPYMWVRVA